MSLFPEDKRAGMVGALATAAVLFVIAFTIVQLTRAAHVGGHEGAGEAPAAQTSGH